MKNTAKTSKHDFNKLVFQLTSSHHDACLILAAAEECFVPGASASIEQKSPSVIQQIMPCAICGFCNKNQHHNSGFDTAAAPHTSGMDGAYKPSIDDILGNADPWPLKDVLAKLIEAAEILLVKKDYDGHGWEEIHHAINRAKKIQELLIKQ